MLTVKKLPRIETSLEIKESFKQLVVDAGRTMIRQNLTVGTWGNCSARDPETGLIYITPSGMDYEGIQPEDIVVLTDRLEIVDGFRVPSVEREMHVAVYNRRPDVNAVIHTHPLYSSVLGVNGMELPGITEDFVQIVGDKAVCSEYAMPGTSQLAANASETLGPERNAVLLPNHGALCVGQDMKWALTVVNVTEKTAHIYIMARSIGTPNLIAMDDILDMQDFARNRYGQR